MKHFTFRLILSTLVLISCSDKDENDISNYTGEGHFIHNGTTYNTPNFDLVLYDEYHDDNYLGYDLTFYSPEMVYVYGDNWHYGNGEAITISLISPNNAGLSSGEYLYDKTNTYESEALPNSIYWGNVEITSTYIDHELIDGSAQITVDGDNYSVSYWLVLSNNDTINGIYSGGMNYYSHN